MSNTNGMLIKVRALKSQGRYCAGAHRFKDCLYNNYNTYIPRGTVMLEVMSDYRFCLNCSEKIILELEKDISDCKKVIMKEEIIKEEVKENTISGVSLLRKPEE